MGLYSVFVIYRDGRTIYSRTFCKELISGVDSDLISGALSGISSLISEVVTGNGQLEQIDSGNTKFVFEWDEHRNFIVVALSDELTSPALLEDLKTATKLISIRYSHVLENWSGDLTEFEKIDDFLVLCFERTLRETYRPICRVAITQDVNSKKTSKLSREEWALLESCDGNKSLFELAHENNMSRIELLTLLNKPFGGLGKKGTVKTVFCLRHKIAAQFMDA